MTDQPALTAEALRKWLDEHGEKLSDEQRLAIEFAIRDIKTMSQKEAAYSPVLRRAYMENMTKVLDILTGFHSKAED